MTASVPMASNRSAGPVNLAFNSFTTAISTLRFHIDGKSAGGHIKQKNRKEDRVDLRRAKYENFQRLTILALRDRTPFGRGWERTLARVVRSEVICSSSSSS